MKDFTKHNVLANGFIHELQSLQSENDVNELKKKIVTLLQEREYSGAQGTRKKYIEKVIRMQSMRDVQFFIYNFILAASGLKTT